MIVTSKGNIGLAFVGVNPLADDVSSKDTLQDDENAKSTVVDEVALSVNDAEPEDPVAVLPLTVAAKL